MSKVKEYIEKQTHLMKNFFPDMELKDLEDTITYIVKDIEKENKIKPKFNFIVEFPDNTPTLTEVSLLAIEKRLEKDQPIITKYGTCFYRQDQVKSILAEMLAFLAKYRTKIKKEMFSHINDTDQTIYNQLDTIQKTIKIIMNSFYGVLTASGSIFFSIDCGASITYSGELIIMTAISIFERFLSNNIKFYSLSDMIVYSDNILSENYEIDNEYKISFKKNISKTDLYKYLINHYYEVESQKQVNYKMNNNDIIAKYINKLNQYERNKIYYKNNFMEFLDNCLIEVDGETDELVDYFELIFEGKFLDPNNPDEEYKENLDSILSVIKDYVFYNYQNFFKYWECHDGERNTVLTVDTDSNFLYLGPYYDFFERKFPDILDGSKEKVITVINCITYFLTYIINETYILLTKSSNIPEEYRSLINMKNEFLINKILLTKNKKQYAYSSIMREGNLIEKPKLEIKGLPIKKVNVNKVVRDYFSEILDKDIINSDSIDHSEIISKNFKLSDIIRNSFLNGETTFSLPEKANSIASYKEPYNQESIRGSVFWNTIFPEDEINFPNKINLFKIKIPNDYDNVIEIIDNYINEKNIKINDKEYETFKIRLQEAFNNEKLFKQNEINVICFPKTLKKFPVYLMPFLNIESMVNKHLSSASTILDAIGIVTPKVNMVNVPSNFIKF